MMVVEPDKVRPSPQDDLTELINKMVNASDGRALQFAEI